jgi:hypothetical protein
MRHTTLPLDTPSQIEDPTDILDARAVETTTSANTPKRRMCRTHL